MGFPYRKKQKARPLLLHVPIQSPTPLLKRPKTFSWVVEKEQLDKSESKAVWSVDLE